MSYPVETAVYTDGLGNNHDFSTDVDLNQFKQGLDGRFMPTWQHYIDTVPGQDGGRYRGTVATLGLYTLPLLICADDVTSLRVRHRELAQAVNPKRGPGYLTIETDDGIARQIRCIYESGFETDPATDGQEYQQLVALKFRAVDPYWIDPAGISHGYTKSDTTAFSPFPLPMRVGPSSIFNQWQETNPGDVEAWPYWIINGPGSNPVLVNETTGKELLLDYSLGSGETIVIDTRPGRKTITGPGGVDLFSASSGELWSLAAGANELRLEMPDAESDVSSLQLQYYPRYVGV
jgi:Phage tail protein